MFPATPHRTAERRLAAPVPAMLPEITWVVDNGKPALEAARITAAPVVCAANPCATSILMIRVPSVRMIRQPPTNVPNAIALAAANTTHSGTWKLLAAISPLATSANVIRPIVFWASLVPCDSASRPLEASWPKRKPRPTGPGRRRPTIRYTHTMDTPATAKATSGATTAGTINLSTRPCHSTEPDPADAKTEPTRPPIKACEELDGNPKYQVIRFHAIAPISPANTTVGVTAPVSTKPCATVAATLSETNAPMKLNSAASATAGLGASARVEIALATTLAVS